MKNLKDNMNESLASVITFFILILLAIVTTNPSHAININLTYDPVDGSDVDPCVSQDAVDPGGSGCHCRGRTLDYLHTRMGTEVSVLYGAQA